MDELLVFTLVVVLINGIFDAVVVAWLAGRRSRAALEAWLESPKTEEALKHILTVAWNWFVTSEIETGRMIDVETEDGVKKEKEKIPPYVMLARSIVLTMKKTAGGFLGKAAANDSLMQQAIGADLQDPNNPLGLALRSALPNALLRAQKTGDYASVVQLVLMPMLQDWLKKRSNQPPGSAAAALNPGGDLRF